MLLSGTEYWNLPRHTGRRQHFENYAIRCVAPREERSLWYQQSLLLQPDQEPIVTVRFQLAATGNPERRLVVEESERLTQARIESDIFYFAAAGGEFYHKGTHGKLEIGGKILEWQLQWEPSERSFRYLPGRLFYRTDWPLLKLVAPNPQIQVSGWVRWGNEEHVFDASPGYQTHSWGHRYPETWVWAQVQQFENHVRTSLEGVSYQFAKNGGHHRRLSQFRVIISGKEYRINRPWQWHRIQTQSHADRWHFEAGTRRTLFIGDVFVDPQQLIGFILRDPDNSPRYLYRTDGAQLKLQVYRKKKGEWDLERELSSLPTMAYEFGTSDPLPDVALVNIE